MQLTIIKDTCTTCPALRECTIELPNDAVSDTTGDDSSNAADKIKNVLKTSFKIFTF